MSTFYKTAYAGCRVAQFSILLFSLSQGIFLCIGHHHYQTGKRREMEERGGESKRGKARLGEETHQRQTKSKRPTSTGKIYLAAAFVEGMSAVAGEGEHTEEREERMKRLDVVDDLLRRGVSYALNLEEMVFGDDAK